MASVSEKEPKQLIAQKTTRRRKRSQTFGSVVIRKITAMTIQEESRDEEMCAAGSNLHDIHLLNRSLILIRRTRLTACLTPDSANDCMMKEKQEKRSNICQV